jgi:signal transduction histidine kinase
VRDTGIGMNDKDIAEALEPFRQLATSRKSTGTGLGLPLTKALVEANRGALHLTSARDEGTLAEVIFPPTRVLAE